MRILVIDDDPLVRDMLTAAAGTVAPTLAFDFCHARSDDEALALLRARADFDLALVGIDGRRAAGMQVFRRLLERSLRIPRIALTDGRDLACIRGALADGAADFLVKPVGGPDLLETLSRVLAQVARRRRKWSERAAYSALCREVDLAADMQRRILPASFPRQAGLDIHATMRPARGIGGDFYDVFEIDRTRLGFLIADVAGKGIPAAFYMAIASTALRAAALGGAAPADCLREANEFLLRRDIPGVFVSVFYGVVDTANWSLECSNGGHPPPFFAHTEGAPRALECAGGPVVGVVAGARYEATRLTLAPGTALVLYTDGVTEAQDAQRRRYGTRALAEVLTQTQGASARDVVAAIDAALTSFADGADQHDDLTALALRRVPAAALQLPRAAA